MAWEEWEQLKAGAGESGSSHMRLNQLASGANGGGEGGRGDLAVHYGHLGKLGDMARDIREQLSDAGGHARQTTFDASVQLFNDGLDLGAALTEEHDAWSTKLAALKEACAHISNHLDYSRSAHAGQDEKIVTDMRNATGQEMTVSRIRDYFK